MIFSPIEYTLKDGRTLILRPPQEADAQEMLALRIKTAGETDFLMNYPEELASYSMEKQLGFISRMQTSENDFMAVAEVDGRIAVTFSTPLTCLELEGTFVQHNFKNTFRQ